MCGEIEYAYTGKQRMVYLERVGAANAYLIPSIQASPQ